MKEILLASASPRRKELLGLLNIPFTVEVMPVDEVYDKNAHPSDVVVQLARLKGEALARRYPERIVISADTIVVCGNTLLGKPKDKADAYQMMKRLSNTEHAVLTGVAIFHQHEVETFYREAKVTFFPLSDDDIIEYIHTDEPYDKAGGYAIQGLAGKFIDSIDGDFYTIVGLPIGELHQRLKKYR